MRGFSFLISRYVLAAILPYFFLTWIILSVIFFVQQAGRFSELLFGTSIPGSLVWQLAIALVPNVIAFTCPIAALVGVIIGISRIQGDRELVAMRAAGVGNLQISVFIVLLGIILSLFAFYVNLRGVPFAAQIVRQVAIQAAILKLESPVEPGVFNTEIEGFTVYVKGGDLEAGTWQKIFIHQDDKENSQVRLITAESGRIGYGQENEEADRSEIVLNDATVTTLSEGTQTKVASETVELLRLSVETRRGELIERLAKTRESPEELGLSELAEYAKTQEGLEQTEAWLLWQRRIILSITPLIFVLLGLALVTKFNRGGRGFGALLSVVSLVFYYLMTLLGEQLARTGSISVTTGGLLPIMVSGFVIVWLFSTRRLFISRGLNWLKTFRKLIPDGTRKGRSTKSSLIDLTTGILDFDLITTLLRNYVAVVVFLTIVYLIFTAFELWKFAGTIENGVLLLAAYLFFLIPFIYTQLAPTGLMIATIATYVIKSRQNEIVTWTAAGRSIYRLLAPCFILMAIIGVLNFGFQEVVATGANRMQDSLRDRIRSRNRIVDSGSNLWASNENRIFRFNLPNASDNNNDVDLRELVVYEFGLDDKRLEAVYKAPGAIWRRGGILLSEGAEKLEISKTGQAKKVPLSGFLLREDYNPLRGVVTKPSHLNVFETRQKIANSISATEQRLYEVSLQKKYSIPFLPFVITLFTAPFALTLGRKGNVVTIAYAVALWLAFMGTVSVFEQFGTGGMLSPVLAIWSPLLVFATIGMILVSRVRT
ncbi:MAG: YjgP/YjgQ family permease [Acidobacteria bacterium]|nr:MAG: YjgP/YjgQ family permease [Acidobacteriota bacterium]REK01422.1 MAG: YjgP/YjgQ family permease [Acidobacteriota bacterium]REK14378.1 MAG: YjgP/YjgQ family permease [Acidobacteriota bacterium]REK45093.1 MAG: YjgP/YjgQ family permease [Acidobacteriota bacterium]